MSTVVKSGNTMAGVCLCIASGVVAIDEQETESWKFRKCIVFRLCGKKYIWYLTTEIHGHLKTEKFIYAFSWRQILQILITTVKCLIMIIDTICAL